MEFSSSPALDFGCESYCRTEPGIAMARRDHLILRLKKAYQYLSTIDMKDLIPSLPRRIILNLQHENWESLEFWFLGQRNEIWSDFPEVCFLAYRYSRKSSGPLKRGKAFIRFVLCRWRIQHLRKLPLEIIRRLTKRFKVMTKYW